VKLSNALCRPPVPELHVIIGDVRVNMGVGGTLALDNLMLALIPSLAAGVVKVVEKVRLIKYGCYHSSAMSPP
jgi:hypothetical protein